MSREASKESSDHATDIVGHLHNAVNDNMHLQITVTGHSTCCVESGLAN